MSLTTRAIPMSLPSSPANNSDSPFPNSTLISSSSQPCAKVVVSPCAACKILRRRCGERCVLAPYFPPSDPLKFTNAHRIFGASNIIKLLQELSESQRIDAVNSIVYEANARLRDPVYGSAGVIFHLQKQISDLQAQLAEAEAQKITMQSQQANLVAHICMEKLQSPRSSPPLQQYHYQGQQQPSFDDDFIVTPDSLNNFSLLDEDSLGSMLDCHWT